MTRSAAASRHHPPHVERSEGEVPSAFGDVASTAGTALRAFFRLADAWELTADEQRTLLGRPSKTTFYRWRHGETSAVTPDLLERLSHLLGIYYALHSVYVEHAHADQWMRRPNDAPMFSGGSPLERLLVGRIADLVMVRRYLDQVAEPAF